MIPPIAQNQKLIDNNGMPTLAFLEILQALRDEVTANTAMKDALAAVSDPSGGATVDAEARTAIAAIIDAAG